MNEIVEYMDREEFKSIFTTELFNKMDKMIEEEKITMENAIGLLKHLGYYEVLLSLWNSAFHSSLLCERFEKMIVDEDEKNEEKNENLLIDSCECYLLLGNSFSFETLSICVPCLLKAALKKKEDEETKTEVEMALLGFSCIRKYYVTSKKNFI
ncbi:uncharacterized protein MONOS_18628 [Monocercomonoides exilis]|uniref:uncharacterized protein n=1 Tax=Monocercomonoides exilis TaxID=2049356 RepID=UPI003559E863|nr:hypothetical protein MONOS_18628 [Monocercomonoides exilis]